MTRFARAKGSKASNEKRPEEPTSWSEMKKAMVLKNSSKLSEEKKEKFKFTPSQDSQKEIEWASLGDAPSLLKPNYLNESDSSPSKTDKENGENNKKIKSSFQNKNSGSNFQQESLKDSPSLLKPSYLNTSNNEVVEEKKEENNKNKNKIKKLNLSVNNEKNSINTKSASKGKEKVFNKNPRNSNLITSPEQKAKNLKNDSKTPLDLEKKLSKKQRKKLAKNKKSFNNLSESQLKEKHLEDNNAENSKCLNGEEMVSDEDKKLNNSKKSLFRSRKRKSNVQVEVGAFVKRRKESDDAEDSENKDLGMNKNPNWEEFKKSKDRWSKKEKFRLDKNKKSHKNFKDGKNFKNGKNRRNQDSNTVIEEIIVNGKKVPVVKFQGFPVTQEDAERLKKLRVDMLKEGIPKDKLEAALKLERRRAEKSLQRLKKAVCFHCRGSGHLLSDCPVLAESQNTSTGICYKCGSTEHSAFECKVVKGTNFQFAECFICKEQGHIARQCPDNPKGLYPQGGACRECGDVTHLRKDCPKFMSKKADETITVGVRNDRNLECLDEEIINKERASFKPNKKRSTVRF